jgi:CyaY protein
MQPAHGNKPTRSHAITDAAKLVLPRIIRNILASMSDPSARTELTECEYSRLTSEMLVGVETTLDHWLQRDVIDIDSARTGGLLEMSFPNGSKIILNTQPPLHEVWLAARAGGFHFRHQNGRWLDTKDGREFFEALSQCASEQAGQPLRFDAPG